MDFTSEETCDILAFSYKIQDQMRSVLFIVKKSDLFWRVVTFLYLIDLYGSLSIVVDVDILHKRVVFLF